MAPQVRVRVSVRVRARVRVRVRVRFKGSGSGSGQEIANQGAALVEDGRGSTRAREVGDGGEERVERRAGLAGHARGGDAEHLVRMVLLGRIVRPLLLKPPRVRVGLGLE